MGLGRAALEVAAKYTTQRKAFGHTIKDFQAVSFKIADSYRVEQLWTGWWGGWGSDRHIEDRANSAAGDGWRLVDRRSAIRLWFWVIPRPKLLLFFEKPT